MNNLIFLNTLIFKIIKRTKDNLYYIVINLNKNYNHNIFILINNSLFNDNTLYTFIKNIYINDNLDSGDFILGKDYFLSKSYAQENNITTEYIFDDLYFNDILFNDKEYKEIYPNIDFNYLYKLNELNVFEFSENDIKYFNRTFANIILENNFNLDIDFSQPKTNIYYHVLKYLDNYKNDATLIGLNLILNSSININNNQINNNSCTCQNNATLSSNFCNNEKTCSNIYIDGINNYIFEMLGDTEFYKNWFLQNNEPNLVMINKLEKLINALLLSDYNYKSLSSNNIECGCSELTYSCENDSILKNYINVLNYIKENKIDENKNKIKIYGNAFGKLLPDLTF